MKIYECVLPKTIYKYKESNSTKIEETYFENEIFLIQYGKLLDTSSTNNLFICAKNICEINNCSHISSFTNDSVHQLLKNQYKDYYKGIYFGFKCEELISGFGIGKSLLIKNLENDFRLFRLSISELILGKNSTKEIQIMANKILEKHKYINLSIQQSNFEIYPQNNLS